MHRFVNGLVNKKWKTIQFTTSTSEARTHVRLSIADRSIEQGQIQDFRKGGLINIFTRGGGYGAGVPLPVTARVSGGALIVPPEPQPLFCFGVCMKLTVISNTYTSRDVQITRARMDSDEKSSQCYSSYYSLKFRRKVCDRSVHVAKHQLHVGYKRLIYVLL